MRIGIDVRCLAEGRRTGVEEYTLNILRNLFEIDRKNEYILFFNSFSKSKVDFSWTDKYSNVKIKKSNFPNKLLNLSFWYLNWPKIDKLVGGVDVFFLPNIIFGSFSLKTKLVLTIHDLSFERYPETFSWKRRLWHFFVNPKKICQRADKIMAVSDSTKEDIKSIYKITSDKIEVVKSGIGENFKYLDRNNPNLIRIKEKYNLPYKFILYLGTFEPRKNISGLIHAFNNLQKKSKGTDLERIKLVLVGHSGWLSREIFLEIEKSDYKEKIFYLGSFPEEEKIYLYNLASVFVYPSLFEGFGFPPLEAIKCEVPVISSNNSSLPEVIEQKGILIDPDRPDEICEALRQVLTSKELQEKLRTTQADSFSWLKSAKKTLNVLEKNF